MNGQALTVKRAGFILAGWAAICLTNTIALAQSDETVRRAFANLRSDKVPKNCSDSTLWLFEHREALKAQMLEELYKTDAQGRDALLIVLFRTDSFLPDERFARFVIGRLAEQDSKVTNHDIHGADRGAHWLAWAYMDKHFELFEPLLAEQVGKTKDGWTLWAIAWLFQERSVLQKHLDLFAPAVLAKAGLALRDDGIRYDAGWATRLFFLLGNASLPTLREVAKSGDVQAKSLARATLDAYTNGSHEAFGYLCSKVNLEKTPFGPEPEPPPWLPDMVDRYQTIETYP
jgi:hypothetical protein